ncbi:MAG: hypothetical protein HC877_01180 [Thioploca sp.]|nr:hypothetical protein [Thioploca sp.]
MIATYPVETEREDWRPPGLRSLLSWSYAPTTGEVNPICDNLPTKTEALRVLPPQFLPEGFILLGSHHNQQLQLQVFDRVSCQRVANQDITIGYDDVEGLAMPIAACQ